jgi:ABC-type sugar transport system ATPase subunit
MPHRFDDWSDWPSLKKTVNLSTRNSSGIRSAPDHTAPRKRDIVAEFAESLSLGALLDRRGDALNLSEMQRVALGRAPGHQGFAFEE